jgi:membrane-bound metal-dependent hydrolase YbcI (DUF457 family)
MFIGHFAVGFAAKRYAPRASLAVLLAAPLFSDLLWPPLLLLGWERVRIDPSKMKLAPLDFVYYPWSHSLLLCAVWATAFALVYGRITHYRPGTVAIWIGVMSHWVLDWMTHGPDAAQNVDLLSQGQLLEERIHPSLDVSLGYLGHLAQNW